MFLSSATPIAPATRNAEWTLDPRTSSRGPVSPHIFMKSDQGFDDVLITIFNHLDFPDQAACAQTCHRWRLLVGQVDFYVQLFRRAGFILSKAEPVHKYINENNIRVIVEKVTGLIHFKHVNYSVNVHYIDELLAKAINCPVLEPYTNKAKFLRAKLKMDYSETALTYENASHLFQGVMDNLHTSGPAKITAQFYRAYLKVKKHVNVPSDLEAFNLLETVSRAKTSKKLHWEAKMYQALLVVEERTNRLTDAQAFDLFSTIANCEEVSLETRAEAQYHRAFLRSSNRIHNITYEEAFNLFDQLSKNKNTPAEILACSLYGKAFLKVEERIDLITDDEAFNLFDRVSKNMQATSWARVCSQYWKAILRGKNRVNSITNDEAFVLFDAVSRSEHAPARIRAESLFYKAVFKIYNRINYISDAQAFNLLDSLSHNQDASPFVRSLIGFHKAYLRAHKRTDRITDEEAFDLLNPGANLNGPMRSSHQYLQAFLRVNNRTLLRITDLGAFYLLNLVADNEDALPLDRANSQYYKAFLRVMNRVDDFSITDDQAFDLLDEVSNNQHVCALIRENSQYLKAYLKLNNRTNRINKDQAITLLSDIIKNRFAHENNRRNAQALIDREDRNAQAHVDREDSCIIL